MMKLLWEASHRSIEYTKYIDSQDPFVSQYAIKLHQDHINGPYPMPRDDISTILPSSTTMSNLASSMVLTK